VDGIAPDLLGGRQDHHALGDGLADEQAVEGVRERGGRRKSWRAAASSSGRGCMEPRPWMSGLAPGAIAYFLTFDHDTGRLEIVASGGDLSRPPAKESPGLAREMAKEVR
jgi:hypothetical protein